MDGIIIVIRGVDMRSNVVHFSITVGWVAEQAALRASKSRTSRQLNLPPR